jgi:hypothetical protein
MKSTGGVDGEDLIGAGVVVHGPLDHDREGLPGDLALALGPGPGDLEIADVFAVDLVEVGEAGVLGGVAPVRPVDRPAAGIAFGTAASSAAGQEEYGEAKGEKGTQGPRENRSGTTPPWEEPYV